MIYVGSLTVPQHNLWADLLVKYQKEHYPDMHEVTRRMPVAESVDDSRRTTLDLMKTYPDLKAVVSFGSNGPIGAGRAVKEKRAKNKVAVYGMMIPSQAASLIKVVISPKDYLRSGLCRLRTRSRRQHVAEG